ncbi:MAG: hypothetical protein HXO52_06565 [Prevotella sp.]|nr:hypothetical protein [Prevotella sp.]
MKEFVLSLLLTICFVGCSIRKNSDETKQPVSIEQTNLDTNEVSGESPSFSTDSEYSDGTDDELTDESSEGSEVEDGTHSATVYYNNPQTGYSATYTLDVEVEDGQVVQIDFPNGGYIDSDHITPEVLNSDGECTIYGDDGKTYVIHIDL